MTFSRVLFVGLLFCSTSLWGQEADHLRIQQLLESSKGDLRIPAGNYIFTGTVEVDLAKLGAVSIRADGPVTIQMRAAGPAFRIVGTHTGSANPSSFKPATWKERMPLLDGFEIVGDHPDADGIELVKTMEATLTRIAVRNARHGIHLVQRNRNVVISNCHLYQNFGIGIYLDDVNLHQINITGTHVSYNVGGGIVVRNGGVRNLQIAGCDIEANMPQDNTPTQTANLLLDQSGVQTDAIAEVSITGCTLQHSKLGNKAPGGANIRVLGNEKHRPHMIAIIGNVLSDTTTHLHLDQTKDITVVGNTFFTSLPTDVLIERSERVVFTGNVFNPRNVGMIGGVRLKDCTHCLIQGATLHKVVAPEGVIALENCDACRISNCLISEPARGIQLVNCRGCAVTDCTITGLPEGEQGVVASGDGENVIRDIIGL